jgi:hypothetical protein
VKKCTTSTTVLVQVQVVLPRSCQEGPKVIVKQDCKAGTQHSNLTGYHHLGAP